jgi:hypothetical protein
VASPEQSIDACIRDVDKARSRVTRVGSKQIATADDKDYLKSVAYAWFRSHRPMLANALDEEQLSAVDAQLRIVLDATSRSSARSTYLASLKTAKHELAALRAAALVPRPIPSTVPDALPNFGALASDVAMKAILEKRWIECQKCIGADASLAATVMMGGLLEALFVSRANLMTNKSPLFKAKSTPIDNKTKKPLALTEWTLRPYIDVGAELGWISSSGREVAAILRDYRNYVHPEKERAHGVNLNSHDSKMFWDVTKNLTHQLLSSVPQKPSGIP